jgi:hypothetical protein
VYLLLIIGIRKNELHLKKIKKILHLWVIINLSGKHFEKLNKEITFSKCYMGNCQKQQNPIHDDDSRKQQ